MPSSPERWVPTADAVLVVEDLAITFPRTPDDLYVVDGASFDLPPNGAIGIVGESGSGKTMLSRALVGTLGRYGARVSRGSVKMSGRELTDLSEKEWREIRGKQIGYVPQSSMAGLNPILTIERQLMEVLPRKESDRAQRKARVRELLELVHIPRADQVMAETSDQLSGGMRQRIVIAAALARNPTLLILDEPTTALDVTVQAEILKLITDLRSSLGMALVFTSHDLAVIEQVCQSVMTMYAGAVVEIADREHIRQSPLHPYTAALMRSRTDSSDPAKDLDTIPGEPPTAGQWPPGCRFHPRCDYAIEACRVGAHPPLQLFDRGASACLRSGGSNAWTQS